MRGQIRAILNHQEVGLEREFVIEQIEHLIYDQRSAAYRQGRADGIKVVLDSIQLLKEGEVVR